MSRTHHNHVDEQRENDEPLELTKSSARIGVVSRQLLKKFNLQMKMRLLMLLEVLIRLRRRLLPTNQARIKHNHLENRLSLFRNPCVLRTLHLLAISPVRIPIRQIPNTLTEIYILCQVILRPLCTLHLTPSFPPWTIRNTDGHFPPLLTSSVHPELKS